MAEINFEAIEKALHNHRGIYEKIESPQNHESQKFINEAEKDLIDLKNGEPESELVKFYNRINSQANGRREKIHKFQFFIYWLTLKMKNPKWENVDAVLEAIWDKNPNLIPVKDSDGFNFKYSSKIKLRYEKREKIGIVLNEMLLEKVFNKSPEFKKFKKNIEAFRPLAMTIIEQYNPKKIRQNIKIRKKIINYLKTTTIEGVTQRDISRKFSKRIRDLTPALNSLELSEIIIWDKTKRTISLLPEYKDSLNISL